ARGNYSQPSIPESSPARRRAPVPPRRMTPALTGPALGQTPRQPIEFGFQVKCELDMYMELNTGVTNGNAPRLTDPSVE
ncbi:MAG TPA: hypothetical protein VG099_10340, partial [Gemmataceae bacterium]|nr:hypothetical protein [Gemmataceae bacterium]